MTRREISGYLDGRASRKAGYTQDQDSPVQKPQQRALSKSEAEKIQRGLKSRFGSKAPKVMEA